MLDSWKARRDLLSFVGIASLLLPIHPVTAQITPDSSLGTQVNGSAITPCTGTCNITNGAIRGNNLFHSFTQFSLPNPVDSATFQTTPATQNVIVRVTGVGQPFISNLNGLIQTSNPANLFLLNPNGIVFGSGARLNIGGSFLATTANRMQFQDGTQFNTTDQAPLLTVSVPIGLQFGQTPAPIQMESSFLSNGQTDSFSDFALVSGSVALTDTSIRTPNRRVEIGSFSEAGTVKLTVDDSFLNLIFSEDIERADLLLSGSRIGAFGENRGGIELVAKNIELTRRSIIDVGIAPGSVVSQAGDINIDASSELSLLQASLIRNILFPGAIGNVGNINIKADSLQLKDGSQIAAGILGQGNSGNISIVLNNRALVDGANGVFPSGILASIATSGVGNAGNINITTGSLFLTNGGQVQALVQGIGNAGNVTIRATDTVALDGTNGNQLRSGIFSDLERGSVGKGGNIDITARLLSVTDAAGILSGAFGNGDAGNVTLQASETVHLDGSGSGVFSNLEGIGKGGEIEIRSGSLSVTNGAQLSAPTFGKGNAGNVLIQARDTVLFSGKSPDGFFSGVFSSVEPGAEGNGGNIRIEANSLSVENGAQIFAATRGLGEAGNITIKALDSILFSGEASIALTNVSPTGLGKGGDINISTTSLTINNGAELGSGTFGQGDAGNIVVQARDVFLFDVADSNFKTGIFSGVGAGARGRGGNINLVLKSFTATNDAEIDASTSGLGDAGSILMTADVANMSSGGQIRTSTTSGSEAGVMVLKVSDRLTLSRTGTGLFADTFPGSSGDGGSIFIDPRIVTIQDGARIAVDSQGSGQGGNIQIQTERATLDNQGSISAQTASRQGGNIQLDAKELLLLRRNSSISTNAGTDPTLRSGNGGNILLNTPLLVAVPRENSDITANASQGSGGAVNITANLFGIQSRPRQTPLSDITASSETGIQGTIAITRPDVDPERGLFQLPTTPTDPSNQIDQSCASYATVTNNRFTVTGSGGLPSRPDDSTANSTLPRLASLPISSTQKINRNHSLSTSTPSIVEAQAAIRLSNGKIRFLSQISEANPAHRRVSCRTSDRTN